VRYPKRKLALFFTVQALGVGAMILLSGGRTSCHPLPLCAPSATSVILATLLIVGELAVIAAALGGDSRVWHGLLALGILFLVIGVICGVAVGVHGQGRVAEVLAAWHLVSGLLLAVAGAGGAVADLLERWRRPDDFGAADEKSSGMWPFD
jgi:hypothetical protein